ncbi:hypothetical protein RO3G_13293 [Rhizopus delemar RA 99-880]|uniref:DDE-1 domain-containing protein n=1 Tax=Rhizopus delemar (strain RA 99-880 / ATCC MYA-4621 / FGSC 9543 / NRRL 43880) TaxID=246409 RepID=I1CJF2_RHIO9|nr:hypothetical protein RO3G_13293 [Rhizopus delemar RA 99-880]|eukprot:EIE88582.1 hypothetical protein RO3G_13293 [Rhizopus delemar RA 99-880]
MPPLNARKRDYLKKHRNETNQSVPHLRDQDWDMSDSELIELSNITEMRNADPTISISINNVLLDNNVKRNRPLSYSKISRSTHWRREKEAKSVNDKGKLESFGFVFIAPVVEASSPILSKNEIQLLRIQEMLPKLQMYVKPVMNSKDKENTIERYSFMQYSSIYTYFIKRIEGIPITLASREAARIHWADNNVAYRAMTIVKWAKEYLSQGVLSRHRQGVHSKRKSFLNDADIKEMVLEEIRRMKPAERSLVTIKRFIDEVVIPSKLGVIMQPIPESTLSNYLHEWDYVYRKNKKTIYFDGHEREDVVEYRNVWSKRMLEYMEKMDFYSGETEEDVLEPNALPEGERKCVFVTHDESTFYANDGKNDMWLADGENYIRKKGPGLSIMVSEFQWPCHGTMKIQKWSSRKLFKAGTARDGWWTSKHMVEQLKEDAIGLFEALHPNCVAVFLFDNSSNHGAFADDALVASRMTLNEKPSPLSEKFQFRDTVYISRFTDMEEVQSFYYEKEIKKRDKKGNLKTKKVRYFKGIRKILEERSLWIGHDLEGKKWKLHCGAPDRVNPICCALHFLENCPDFKNQKSVLEEVIITSGHIFELYPKYHCECNWIEMYWGAAKREARLKCDYTFKSLEENIDSFLDKAGDLAHIRRYFRRSMDFIEAYSRCTDGREVVQVVKKFVEKKYLSHRKVRVPSDLV